MLLQETTWIGGKYIRLQISTLDFQSCILKNYEFFILLTIEIYVPQTTHL